ncbi:hypothetical protein MRB53_037379 [Persea americana]|nr:hypothetical protein MRB53_037379 [Persea americana]
MSSSQGEQKNPSSPHNVSSSPTAHSPQNFLSVPNARPRGHSLDSDISEQTFVATPGASTAGDSSRSPSRTRQFDSTSQLINDESALTPDPGREADFEVEDNKFGFSPGQLGKMHDPKSLAAFHALGGPQGVAKGLRTDLKAGLSVDEKALGGYVSFEDATAKRPNDHDAKPSQSHANEVSQSSQGEPFADRKRVFKDNRLPERKSKGLLLLMWQTYNDKVLILLSIAAVVSLAIGIYQSVDATDGEAPVEWVEGVAIMVAIIIVVIVGALNDWQKERQFVKLNRKKEGRFVKVIRSGKTQELSVYDVLAGDLALLEPGDIIPVDGLFLEGHNPQVRRVVSHRRIRSSQEAARRRRFPGHGEQRECEEDGSIHLVRLKVTPLQSKLNDLAEYIAKLGGLSALLYFIVAFIEFLVQITKGSARNDTAADKGQLFLNIFITAVSIIVVAVPEGLPLAVTLALAFATTRMLKDNNLVRLLRSCETMGNATTVCSDKTGTLTQNKMTVVSGTFGTSLSFHDKKEKHEDGRQPSDAKATNASSQVHGHRGQSSQGQVSDVHQGRLRDSSSRQSTKIVADPNSGLETEALSQESRKALDEVISSYASRSLRTIALMYREFDSWPPRGARKQEDDPSQVVFEDLFKDMTFLGVVGIQDPLRPGVNQAVKDFKKAGVVVRMVTGDNVETAKAIATECGIFDPEHGTIMEGPVFRKLSRSEMAKVIPDLQVLARSSPEDKRILVKRLKELGETVAVTGDGTNDAPALKTADVGFSMGIAGTEVAKEASAIILMDDNFSSIVKALLWGRAVNDAVKKFLQFQITVNITAVLVTFVTGVSGGWMESSVLSPVQLLWVNLIMDTFAALALATDPPSLSMLDRKPDRKSAPLITTTMWKMIIGQAIYQLVIIFVLNYAGLSIFNYTTQHEKDQFVGFIFNVFVWCQIFNAFTTDVSTTASTYSRGSCGIGSSWASSQS